jgi:hypothetical protein
VSHAPQRTEKDCLNCGTIVQGHYCQHCGQENIVPKETFWHMVTHFFYDITHFDGSFFTTLKDLLFKPGFLTREYMNGRRKSYLHPVRMYVFTSAVFFLVFFSLFKVKETDVERFNNDTAITEGIRNAKEDALRKASTKEDSLQIIKATDLLLPGNAIETTKTDTGKLKQGYGRGVNIKFGNGVENYKSVAQYDSVQKTLTAGKRNNWFVNMIMHKSILINLKYKGDQGKMFTKLTETFLHSIPYLLFVSLPLYALFLKLLYVRRKQFYFADHGIFLIHLYVFTFLFLLLFFMLNKLDDVTGWKVLIGVTQAILIFIGLFYTLKAMKNFYRQGWGKTIAKFIFFNLMCLVAAIILFSFFFVFSLFQI